MTEVLCVVAGVTLFTGAIAWQLSQVDRWRRVLAEAATELGVTLYEADLSSAHLEGVVAGHPVRVDTFHMPSGRSNQLHTRIRVGSGLMGVNIRAEGVWTQLTGAAVGQDVKTGDLAFDETVRLDGPPGLLSALLDDEIRTRIRRWVEEGTTHEHDGWVSVHRGFLGSSSAVVDRVRQLVALSRDLRVEDLESALVERLRTEPLPSVRAYVGDRLLGVLAERAPLARGALEPFSALPWSPAQRVRLVGLGGGAGRDALRGWLRDADPLLATEAAVALAGLPDAHAEPDLVPALVALLPRAELRVIEALGRLGSVEVVPALHGLADRVLVLDGSAAAAREAIRSIQSRVVGAERGGVSVVEVGGGELSGAPPRAGEVSVAARHRRAGRRAERRPR